MSENPNLLNNSKENNSLGYQLGSWGVSFPIININGYTINKTQINNFEIRSEKFQPVLYLSFRITNGIFITKHFPKDGDVVSVFIRSMNKALKPIRNDFFISNVMTSRSDDLEGNSFVINLIGILRLPRLYSSVNKVLKEQTSLEALTNIANDLGLGLVTNINNNDLKDKMNWLSLNDTYIDFIKHITKYSYKDDVSFFNSWIDFYYNLTFMNLDKMYSIDDTELPMETVAKSLIGQDDFSNLNKVEFIKSYNVFSNIGDLIGSDHHFNSFEFINNSGYITSLQGYINNINFYDVDLNEKIDFNIESSTTDDSSVPKIVMKGRPNEDIYKNEIKKYWNGWNYKLPDHNVHEYFKEAEYQNLINIGNINKLKIKIYMSNPNMNIYVGQRIPIIFFNTFNENRIKISGNVEDNTETVGFAVDKFLSGNYVISGIIYNYKHFNGINIEDGKIKQEVILSRREWTFPDKID